MSKHTPVLLVTLILVLIFINDASLTGQLFITNKGYTTSPKNIYQYYNTRVEGADYAAAIAKQCIKERHHKEYEDCCYPKCWEQCNGKKDCQQECTRLCVKYESTNYLMRPVGTYPAIGTYATDQITGRQLGTDAALNIITNQEPTSECKHECFELCPRRASWWPKRYECQQVCTNWCTEFHEEVRYKA